MHLEHFRPLLASRGPFGSVYFDDSHDTEDADRQIELKWRSLREELETRGADPQITENIARAIEDARPAVGRSGRALVASPEGVLVDEHLIRPTSSIVRVSPLPYLVPVVEHGVGEQSYVVVIVDHQGADITRIRGGAATSETVDADAYPVHKASGAETPGYGDAQRAPEGARQQNIRTVADRLTALVDDDAPAEVFVVGEVQSRADLMSQLPDRVASRVVELHVGARGSGFDDADLRHEIEQALLGKRLELIDSAAQRFTAEIGRDKGLAVEGLHAVTAALRAGAVETLIIGELGDATVVAGDDIATVAPNENVLSELGAAPTQTLRADEALPMVAIATDAELVRTDERIAPADGIGAILRYALP
jgi:hypothetical protein